MLIIAFLIIADLFLRIHLKSRTPLNRARVVSKIAIMRLSVRYQPIAYRLMGTGGIELSGLGLAVLDLLFGVLVDILSEIYDHEDGDDGAEAFLHEVECMSCFHCC